MVAARPTAIALCLFVGLAQVYAQTRADALQMYRQGRYDQARETCLAEISENPSNIESYVVLVWSLLALGRYQDAELYGTRAFTSVRRDPRIAHSLGEAAFNLGKNDVAIGRFRDYINLLPEGAQIGSAYYFLGEVYLRQDRLQHADIALRTALQFDPRNARWWTRLGYVRERAEDWVHSLQAYQAALAINPGLTDAVRGKERVEARARQ